MLKRTMTWMLMAGVMTAFGCGDDDGDDDETRGGEGPVEEAGEAVEDATDEAGESVEEAGDSVEDATDDDDHD